MKRVALIGSPDKPAVEEAFSGVRAWLASRADVVFADVTYDSAAALAHDPELLIVLGGDGTLIAAVHGLGERQLPILGINLGKLGYLAEFTLEQFQQEGGFLFSNGIPVARRLLLDVRLDRPGQPAQQALAVNDCVLLAGTPFRMISMTVTADGDQVVDMRGDGLIIATPSGSTAHNLSAGGPILEPTAEAFILTPLCPHALTFRPVVMDARHTVELRLLQGNAGTTVSIDGQRNWPLHAGDRLQIRRFAADFQLVRNPRYSLWSGLRRKLMWGADPVTNQQGHRD